MVVLLQRPSGDLETNVLPTFQKRLAPERMDVFQTCGQREDSFTNPLKLPPRPEGWESPARLILPKSEFLSTARFHRSGGQSRFRLVLTT
jgi:hypothetical protein